MKKIGLCLSLCILCGAVLHAQAPLKFVYTSYVPANYTDARGSHQGFFVEIIREALEKRMGIPVSLSVHPWPRCQYMVREGLADMMATIPTPERRAYSVTAETPIWIKKYSIYTVNDHPAGAAMDGIRSVQDLKRSGLVVLSYEGNDWARTVLETAGIKVINASSVEGMYRMLMAGRGDVIVEDPLLVRFTLKALGIEDRVRPTAGIVKESSFHLMIGKASPFASRVPYLDRTLREMYEDGTMARILESNE